MKDRVIFSAGDLPGGAYFGLDKELLQVCLEIRAIDWKMAQLRAASALQLSNPATQAELDEWDPAQQQILRVC
jgi:hypothetical protein